jgi:hypothetical protein
MACETTRSSRTQTLTERKAEIKEVLSFIDELIRKSKVRVIVDKKTGAVFFDGMTVQEKRGVTDGCAYRMLMATGSASAKQAIARAEALAGRGVNRQALAQGVHGHAHGGTVTFHNGH